MNNTLANTGIHNPKLRKRAIAIGEKLGMYRDYPVSKGCTSPSPRFGLTILLAGLLLLDLLKLIAPPRLLVSSAARW